MVAWATEIKLRAERRTGELLRETAKTGERRTAAHGRPRKGSSAEEAFKATTLKTLGLTENQSSDWQQLAAIPAPEFEVRLWGPRTPR